MTHEDLRRRIIFDEHGNPRPGGKAALYALLYGARCEDIAARYRIPASVLAPLVDDYHDLPPPPRSTP